MEAKAPSPEMANELQRILFDNKIPKFHPKYSNSPELLHFLYMLLLSINIDPTELTISDLDQIIHTFFCTDTRDVVRYRATSTFILELGAIPQHIDLPRFHTPARFRVVNEGDTILVRHDSKLGKTEVQILPFGLFGPDEYAEFRIFNIDINRISMYHKFMVKERFEIE